MTQKFSIFLIASSGRSKNSFFFWIQVKQVASPPCKSDSAHFGLNRWRFCSWCAPGSRGCGWTTIISIKKTTTTTTTKINGKFENEDRDLMSLAKMFGKSWFEKPKMSPPPAAGAQETFFKTLFWWWVQLSSQFLLFLKCRYRVGSLGKDVENKELRKSLSNKFHQSVTWKFSRQATWSLSTSLHSFEYYYIYLFKIKITLHWKNVYAQLLDLNPNINIKIHKLCTNDFWRFQIFLHNLWIFIHFSRKKYLCLFKIFFFECFNIFIYSNNINNWK